MTTQTGRNPFKNS